MALSRSAIIVIVLVACLAVTAGCAAMYRGNHPLEEIARSGDASPEQNQYMRQVRMRNYGHLKRASLGAAKDLESRYTSEEASAYYQQYAQEPRSPSTNA
ncbi:hypothetical protein N7486_006276 [Penicillium sp. IBT 16267x]|nr:hypothetical protein N7486_006276 [Penicillium sp. IBT 16267x]